MLKTRWAVALLVPILLLVAAACGGEDPTPTPKAKLAPTATSAPAEAPAAPAAPAAPKVNAPSAAPTAPTPIPDTFPAEWDALVAAAQEEGEVVVILGGSASRIMRPVVEAFGKKFGIKAVAAAGRDSDHVTRILAERAAGQFLVDATHLGPTTTRSRAIPAGLIDVLADHLIQPDVLDKSNWFQGRHWYADAGEKYLFTHSANISNAPVTAHYNTDLVSQEEIDAITSIFDLLDPKWAGGKIVSLPINDAGAGGTWYSIYVHPDVGKEWTDKFIREMDPIYTPETRLAADWLAQGKVHWAMAVGAAGRDLDKLAAQGVPVAKLMETEKEAATLSGSGSSNNTAIFTKPAHPNAAKLYVNWFLSKEGQTTMQAIAQSQPDPSLRIDGIPQGLSGDEDKRDPNKDYYFLSADPSYLQFEPEAMLHARGTYTEVTGG
jgi:iron(III) transport system substrate-binding protein